MNIKGWKYYNHAAIPDVPPHKNIELTPVDNGEIWKLTGGDTPLLARWTSDFDCGYETNWWYVVKDKPFDLASLKAKRRYEINKGIRNFEDFLVNGGTICDGARNISHETNFQDYLEKYFGFRKVYCHLHIRYNPKIKWKKFIEKISQVRRGKEEQL